MTPWEPRTPSEIGERAEAAIAAALAQAGKSLLIPFGQYRYDLAYEDGGRLVKVQCKTGHEKNGAIGFQTCSNVHGERRDYQGDVHLFGVYCHDRKEVYLVPVNDVPRRAAHLRLTPARNGQVAGIREASQYLVRDGPLPDAVDRLRGSLTAAAPPRPTPETKVSPETLRDWIDNCRCFGVALDRRISI